MAIFGKVVDLDLIKYCTTTHKKQTILQSLSPLQSRLHLTVDSHASTMCDMLVDVILDTSIMGDKKYAIDTKNMVLRALKTCVKSHDQLDYNTALAMKDALMRISQVNRKFDLTMYDIELELNSVVMDCFNECGDIDKANELAQVFYKGLQKRLPLSGKILYLESIYRLIDLSNAQLSPTKNLDYIDIAKVWLKTCCSVTKDLRKAKKNMPRR